MMINIAELLKDAPKGMKLYSPLFGEVEFYEVGTDGFLRVHDTVRDGIRSFDFFGRYFYDAFEDAECLIFPSKECRTWEGWKLSVKPKFKAEDRIVSKSDKSTIYRIITLHEERREYIVEIEHKDYHESCPWIAFEDQDDYELAPKPHHDIANFQPYDKVLTRDTERGNWNVNLFSYYIDDEDERVIARFRCINSLWKQCIPFNDDTKHLLGTTDMCDEQYINW